MTVKEEEDDAEVSASLNVVSRHPSESATDNQLNGIDMSMCRYYCYACGRLIVSPLATSQSSSSQSSSSSHSATPTGPLFQLFLVLKILRRRSFSDAVPHSTEYPTPDNEGTYLLSTGVGLRTSFPHIWFFHMPVFRNQPPTGRNLR